MSRPTLVESSWACSAPPLKIGSEIEGPKLHDPLPLLNRPDSSVLPEPALPAQQQRENDCVRTNIVDLKSGPSASLANVAPIHGVQLNLTVSLNQPLYSFGRIEANIGIKVKHDDAFHERLQKFWMSLPADQFPNLVAMAIPLTTGDGDERFEFGLDLLVRGIASTATRPSAP